MAVNLRQAAGTAVATLTGKRDGEAPLLGLRRGKSWEERQCPVGSGTLRWR